MLSLNQLSLIVFAIIICLAILMFVFAITCNSSMQTAHENGEPRSNKFPRRIVKILFYAFISTLCVAMFLILSTNFDIFYKRNSEKFLIKDIYSKNGSDALLVETEGGDCIELSFQGRMKNNDFVKFKFDLKENSTPYVEVVNNKHFLINSSDYFSDVTVHAHDLK